VKWQAYNVSRDFLNALRLGLSTMPARGKAAAQFVFVRGDGRNGQATQKIVKPGKLHLLHAAIQAEFKVNLPVATLATEGGQPITDIRDVTPGMRLVVTFSKAERPRVTAATPSQRDSLLGRPGLSQPFRHTPLQASEDLSYSDSSPYGSPISRRACSLQYYPQDSPLSLKPPTVTEAEEEIIDESTCASPEVEKLIIEHIPIRNIRSGIADGFHSLPDATQSLITNLGSVEEVQKWRYHDEIIKIVQQEGFYAEVGELHCGELLAGRAESFIANHRSKSAIGPMHFFQAAITGPPHSGRSTYLGLITESLLLSLMATDTWKRTFVFVADAVKLFHASDPTQLYQAMIRHLFALFRAQAPHVIQFLPQIEAAFLGLVEATTRPGQLFFPRKLTKETTNRALVTELTRIADLLIAAWFDSGGLQTWAKCLVYLPHWLATAFGFTEIIYVFDHFDCAWIQVCPMYPFEDSTEMAPIDEYLKAAMLTSSYIVSAKSSEELVATLEKGKQNGVGLDIATEYVTLVDFVEHPVYGDAELLIAIGEKHAPLRLGSECCGGVPLFLAKWEDVNKAVDALMAVEKEAPDFQDLLCEAICAAEQLLVLIFGSTVDPLNADYAFDIEDVRRGRAK
jgi:hypothetical protein